MEIAGEFWSFLKVRKKLWLGPIVVIMLMMAVVMGLAAKAGVLQTFIYAGV